MKPTNIKELYLQIKQQQSKTSTMIMDVYNELAALEAEITAEDLWLQMVRNKKISFATVYKHLRLLADMGFINRRSDGSSRNKFKVHTGL